MTTNSDRDRQLLYGLLGDLPERSRPIAARVVDRRDESDYRLEKLELDLNGFEPVPAYFVSPRSGAGPWPCVLYNHAHGGDYALGKDEFIESRGGMEPTPYARELASRGYAGLCIDTWAFGERNTRTEGEIFREMLWKGQVMWGMMMYDSLRAVDYLSSRPDVDATRLATMGASMGSTMAWWLAALDTRIKVCIDICCLTDFHELIKTRGLNGHGIYYYVPSLLKHFTTARINALITPRLHLALEGDNDGLTPPAGLDRIDAELRNVYAAAGAPEAWVLKRYDTGHGETAEMRAEALAFLRMWL